VTRIDLSSAEVVGDAIPVGEKPISIAAGEGGVWVVNTFGSTISRISIRREGDVR